MGWKTRGERSFEPGARGRFERISNSGPSHFVITRQSAKSIHVPATALGPPPTRLQRIAANALLVAIRAPGLGDAGGEHERAKQDHDPAIRAPAVQGNPASSAQEVGVTVFRMWKTSAISDL